MYIFKSGLSNADFIKSDSFYKREYMSQLDREYDEVKNENLEPLTEELFSQFKRSGVRLPYEKIYFRRRTILRDCALKAWFGEAGAAARLESVMDEICAEKNWALPAHTDGIDDETIDLFAAETAHALTEIISLGLVSDKTARRSADEVKRRVLTPFINRSKPYNWESMQSNWCAVCGGSVGMVAIYLIEDTDELNGVINSLRPTLERYFLSFSDDGACLEGLYYWNYGMTYYTAFLDLYKQRMGEAFLRSDEKFREMADFPGKCCMTDGFTVSFSDGGERDRIYAGIMNKLSKEYGSSSVPDEYLARFSGDECGRWCKAARDVAWFGVNVTAESKNKILPKAQWAILCGDGFTVSVKGGANGEPHNHNDVGAFSAVKNGRMIICDLGAGEYTADYFSDKRYGVFCNSSFGHSVPIIDGGGQKHGTEYGAKNFRAGQNTASLDISGAYGSDKLLSLNREILCSDTVTVRDNFKFDGPARVTERFITRLDAKIADGTVYIVSNGETVAELIPDGGCIIDVNSHVHSEHNGETTTVRSIDFSFDVNNERVFMVKMK